MSITHLQKLRLLLENVSDTTHTLRRRVRVGEILQKQFPPNRNTELYGRILREENLSDDARWSAMLMMYYVGNDACAHGFIAFLEDPQMSKMLKVNVATLLLSLCPRLERETKKYLPKYPVAWLTHGAKQLPGASESERREYVIEQLLFNLFDEGND